MQPLFLNVSSWKFSPNSSMSINLPTARLDWSRWLKFSRDNVSVIFLPFTPGRSCTVIDLHDCVANYNPIQAEKRQTIHTTSSIVWFVVADSGINLLVLPLLIFILSPIAEYNGNWRLDNKRKGRYPHVSSCWREMCHLRSEIGARWNPDGSTRYRQVRDRVSDDDKRELWAYQDFLFQLCNHAHGAILRQS